jgi:alpha-tubulin suppressor-like RCC1 family protein
VQEDGSLWCWGQNDEGQLGTGTTTGVDFPVRVGLDSDWASVHPGYGFTCGRRQDGSLWCWGHNDRGQLGDGTQEDRLVPTPVQPGWSWLSVGVGD